MADQLMTDGECPLCSPTLGPELGASTYWRVILNRNQILLGKCMLVLRRHEVYVRELTAAEWSDLQDTIRKVTTALIDAFAPDHFNYAFLQNQDHHVHLHVIPRYASERRLGALAFSDSGFPNHYIVDETRMLTDAQLAQVGSEVQTRLGG